MQKTIYSPAYRKMIHELRLVRGRLGLRQGDVGCQLGVSRHWLQKIETCQVRLDVLRFVLLCRVYRTDASRLIRQLERREWAVNDAHFLLPIFSALLLQLPAYDRQDGGSHLLGDPGPSRRDFEDIGWR